MFPGERALVKQWRVSTAENWLVDGAVNHWVVGGSRGGKMATLSVSEPQEMEGELKAVTIR